MQPRLHREFYIKSLARDNFYRDILSYSLSTKIRMWNDPNTSMPLNPRRYLSVQRIWHQNHYLNQFFSTLRSQDRRGR